MNEDILKGKWKETKGRVKERWGYYHSGGIGFVLLIVLILLLMGRI